MALAGRLVWMALTPLFLAGTGRPAQVSLREISEALARATPEHPIDFAGRDLSYLNLSGLNLAQARLAGADLHGADLTDANLSRADLAGANLDHAVIIRANFGAANLPHASLRGLAAYSTLEPLAAEAPNFAGANLSGAAIYFRLGRVNLRGADLSGVQMGTGPGELRTNMRNDLAGCDLTDANLSHADLHEVRLPFAHLAHANLSDTDFTRADLAHADLSGADVTGADFTGADVDQAVMTDARGLDQAKGLDAMPGRRAAKR